MLILELAEQSAVQIIGSQMLVREMADTQDSYKRTVLQMVYGICSEEIKITAQILERSEEIRHSSNIKYKDSLHLACAEAAKADVLLTTDRKFMNHCSRIKHTQKCQGQISGYWRCCIYDYGKVKGE